MKRQTFLKLWLAVFSGLAVAVGIVLACGGDWDYWEWASSSFTPEAVTGTEYRPLFFDPNIPFYEIGNDTEHTSRFNSDVTADWHKFMNGKVSKETIAELMLSNETDEDIAALYQYVGEKRSNDRVNRWRQKLDLSDRRVVQFIEFTFLAKQVDYYAAPVEEGWNYYTSARSDKNDMPLLLIQALKEKYENTSDSFLKNRYWFQCLKAMFYANRQKEYELFFGVTERKMPKNQLYYRGLGYLAAFKYGNRDYLNSNLLYAEIFDKLPAMRTVAAWSFHLVDEAEWQKNLRLATTTEQKISLWALLGFYHDEERAIAEIYKLNPKSDKLDFLLTRLINKKEEGNGAELFGSKAMEKSSVDPQLLSLLTKIADEQKTANPFLWYAALGYVHTWQGKYSSAEKLFDKAYKVIPAGKPMAADQIRLLRLVNSVNAIKNVKGNSVENIIGELKWLYSLDYGNELRYRYAQRESKKYLSQLYANSGNALYSELFNHQDTFFEEKSNIDRLVAFLLKKNKSPFEKVLTEIYPITLQDIYHYKAVVAVFADDLESAMTYMQKTGEIANGELRGNPFNGFIKDCNDCDHKRRQTVKYSRRSVIEKMQEMKQKIMQYNDVYNNALLLANAYYNLSYYGNARYFWRNSGLIYPGIPSDPIYIPSFAQKMLTDGSSAKKYYLRALEAAQNDEQRAKVTYMLAKCERNEFYNRAFFAKSDNYAWKRDANQKARDISFGWNSFKVLKEKYAHTQYYQDVINECGYFSYYVD